MKISQVFTISLISLDRITFIWTEDVVETTLTVFSGTIFYTVLRMKTCGAISLKIWNQTVWTMGLNIK